jgi:catechol 2,3-dioxygenase-like lactoylglutathione lyase family enzyme
MRFLRPCLLAAFILFAIAGYAQIPPPTTLTGIAHVALRVSDLSRSRDFYQKLGFDQSFAFTKDGTTTEVFLKVNDQQFIEMYPQQQPPEEIGFMHVCFESTDLEQLNHAYVARGLSPTPVKRASAGNLLFTMVGPEQQNIEYTQYMPGSLHSKDQGQHLGANRISQEIFGVTLRMEDPVVARSFYEQMLGFHESRNVIDPELVPLLMPGTSVQVVEISPGVFQLLLLVPSLRHAATQLSALHIEFEKEKSMLIVKDPDGNRVAFLTKEPDTGRLPFSIPKLTR